MVKIIRILYNAITILGILATGSNTILLKEMEGKLEQRHIQKMTTHSEIEVE